MNVWFTADTHFNHANILRHCHRPFGSVQDHDQELIRNWNNLVQPKDVVYHLGDFAWGSPQFIYDTFLSKLHGRIFLIKGNHDKSVLKSPCKERFEWIKDVHFLKVQESVLKGKHNGPVEIFLSHYAHRSWVKSHHGSFHLYGHSHGGLPPYGKSFDVGVDCCNYRPIDIITVLYRMETL